MTSSISGAQSAIGTIAKALLTGQTAPADARDQVKSNLLAAQSTLAGITSCVPASLLPIRSQCQFELMGFAMRRIYYLCLGPTRR